MSNLHPIFQAITENIKRQAPMASYLDGLAGFDWQYPFTDEGQVYSRWHAEHQRLSVLQREVDPGGAIWERFRSQGGRGAPGPLPAALVRPTPQQMSEAACPAVMAMRQYLLRGNP